MTLEELTQKVATARTNGLDYIMLVITRRSAPGRFNNKIRVKGLGIGEVANCQEKNGMHEIVAWFKCDAIEKTLRKALPSPRREDE